MLQRLKSLRTWMGALTAIALLAAWPALTQADHMRSWDDSGDMPSWWSSTPPASQPIDSRQLADLLLKKGVISPQELALLQGGEVAQAKAGPQPCAVSQSVSR